MSTISPVGLRSFSEANLSTIAIIGDRNEHWHNLPVGPELLGGKAERQPARPLVTTVISTTSWSAWPLLGDVHEHIADLDDMKTSERVFSLKNVTLDVS